MYDFEDIKLATKDEQIRAWAVEKAIETVVGLEVTDREIVDRARQIEKYVVDGRTF